ncbi:competence type IV pilus minor pilin ComGG [Streptococcus sp. DD13]|uniref:competence type IV pilus minor pilin ComGG n=1 Tax=Streptococcus sp. DD13 TaxID=1777881 RepID=UPI000791C690|nr:competence type IV pilus minor pilin ComGG [Streptococcus sp. DD13]KXT77909.1 Late competence protein ComGG [Streptococcus sp. DD13]
MLFKKQVKAGILLYALLMLAVFSLLLNFYLHRQTAAMDLHKEIAKNQQARAIAYVSEQELRSSKELLKDQKRKGTLTYQEGLCDYVIEQDWMVLIVRLPTGESYEYQMAPPSKSS